MQALGVVPATSLSFGESAVVVGGADGNGNGGLLAVKLRGGRKKCAPGGSCSSSCSSSASHGARASGSSHGPPRAVLLKEAGAGSSLRFRVQSSVTTEPTGRSFLSAEQKVFEVVAKQAAMVDEQQRRSGSISLQDVRTDLTAGSAAELLDEAYVRCGEVCAEYAKTFYLGQVCVSLLIVLLFTKSQPRNCRNR